jgi:hypothetical protein
MSARPKWHVTNRKNAGRWADSILPLSPRAVLHQEVGHKTSAKRRATISSTALMGAFAAPSSRSASSDKQLEPTPYELYRAQIYGEHMRSAPGNGSEASRTTHARRMLQQAIQQRKNREREMNWEPTAFRGARRRANTRHPFTTIDRRSLKGAARSACLRCAGRADMTCARQRRHNK